jgi:hypothetical protein
LLGGKEDVEEEEEELINSKGKNSECNRNEGERVLGIEIFGSRIERTDCRLWREHSLGVEIEYNRETVTRTLALRQGRG